MFLCCCYCCNLLLFCYMHPYIYVSTKKIKLWNLFLCFFFSSSYCNHTKPRQIPLASFSIEIAPWGSITRFPMNAFLVIKSMTTWKLCQAGFLVLTKSARSVIHVLTRTNPWYVLMIESTPATTIFTYYFWNCLFPLG